MAGCPLQSVVWKYSEGKSRVRQEEEGEDQRRNPVGWAGRQSFSNTCAIEEPTTEEAVKYGLEGMRITTR